MDNFLIKKFVKDHENYQDEKVRVNYGVFASFVGIVTNIILFIIKIILGVFSGSVSIIGDSFNNLSDSLASVISLISFKLSSRPADAEHPFGHGRTEYIASLIVAFFIGVIGVEVFKSSVGKIINPEGMVINKTIMVIMVITVIMKLWQSMFYKKIGNSINSKLLLATAKDSLGDVVVTSCTIFSAGILYFSGYNIDGYVGLIVSGFLFKAAYDVAVDTFSIIIGESPSPELCGRIKKEVESYDGILGVHDLIVHSYGANNYIVTLHAEVSSKVDIVDSHCIVDKAEYEVGEKLGIHLTLHMDPVDVDNPILEKIKSVASGLIEEKYDNTEAHDFRLVVADGKTNVIFDLEVPHSYDVVMQNKIKNDMEKIIKKIDDNYECIINVEYRYTTY